MMSHCEKPEQNGAWYLLHCQTQKEFYVAEALKSRLMAVTYVPQCQVWSRGEKKRAAFFPGYIFIYADLQELALSAINASYGVIRLVEVGGEPCSVPQSVIDGIVLCLEEYHQQSPRLFEPGDHVRFCGEGPLQDLDMIFVGPSTATRRVYVLLNLLGRLKEIQVESRSLEKIKPWRERGERERYTREKGRKINLGRSYSA